MVSKEELKTCLRELRSEADIARIREKAQKFLEDVDPKVLSLAEQELIQERMDPRARADLRSKKKALKKLVDERETLDFDEFAESLRELAGYIVPTLRSHISKENNILYPTALKSLEEKQWEAMKKEFDTIGYCCFTRARSRLY